MSACPHGDKTCPCQDGDVCHYVDDPKSETLGWPPPDWRTRALPNRMVAEFLDCKYVGEGDESGSRRFEVFYTLDGVIDSGIVEFTATEFEALLRMAEENRP